MALILFVPLLILAPIFISSLMHKKPFTWLHSFFRAGASSSADTHDLVKEKAGDHRHRKLELERVFDTFDRNGDGFITKQELQESLRNVGFLMDEKEMEEIVERLDINGDGLVDFNEFCELFDPKKEAIEERERDLEGVGGGGDEGDLKEAFNVFDGDRDGLITVEELGTVLCSLGLKEGRTVEDCEEMIRKVDSDGDGMVNFDEFKKMMINGTGMRRHLVSVF